MRSSLARALILLIAASLLVGPAAGAQDATPAATPAATPVAGAEATYVNPAGRFTVPIPTGWRAETIADYGVLRSPEGDITVYLLVEAGNDPLPAVEAAWRRVNPAFSLEPLDVLEPPPPPGVERVVLATYDVGDTSGEVIQGVGQLAGGVVYVQLYRGELAAVVRRLAQIQIIDSGFAITGGTRVDLTGVAPRPLTPALLAELEAYVVDTMTRLRVPGAAVAIVQDGAVVYERGFGVRELGKPEPVTPQTRMMIGSTTKPLTTLMMATLVDDGRMSWDTPVVDLLPAFAVADPELTPRLTVRNLVCACTGVPSRHLELLFNSDDLSAEAVVQSLAGFEFYTGFGEAFQYSNELVATAGYAAAVAAGGRETSLYAGYVAAMQERVLDPIGMADSTFSFSVAEASPDRATPHQLTFDGDFAPIPLEAEELLTPVAPAGALWSNTRDMARFVLTELNRGVAPDGTRVVSTENLAATWQPQVPVSAETSYGLGWFVDEYKGQPLIHHGGNTLGFTSDLAFLPDAGLGIVTLANGQYTNLFNEAVRFRLLELAFDQAPEFEQLVAFGVEQGEQGLEAARAAVGDQVDPELVRPFLGTYANPALGEVTLALREAEATALVLDAGEFQTELRPLLDERTGERFMSVSPPLIGLTVDLRLVDGRPTLVVVDPGSAGEYVFAPVGATAATPAATPTAWLEPPLSGRA